MIKRSHPLPPVTIGAIAYARVQMELAWAGDRKLTEEQLDIFTAIMAFAKSVLEEREGKDGTASDKLPNVVGRAARRGRGARDVSVSPGDGLASVIE